MVCVCLYGFVSALSLSLFVGEWACPSRCTEPFHSHNPLKSTTTAFAPTNPSKSALSRPHSCKYSVYLYEHGTHFVFPESVLKKALPVGADTLVNMSFSAAKKFPAECKAMRLDLDKKLTEEILNWKSNN